MGSHILDLIQFLIKESKYNLISSKIKSIVSDVDDIVEAKFKTDNKIDVSINLNWVKKDVRKPIFSIEIEMIDGQKYLIDQQQIKIHKNDKNENTISVTDLQTQVPYYLRGVDFTNQMIDLIGETKLIASVEEAFTVNRIMNQIYNDENNTRR